MVCVAINDAPIGQIYWPGLGKFYARIYHHKPIKHSEVFEDGYICSTKPFEALDSLMSQIDAYYCFLFEVQSQ